MPNEKKKSKNLVSLVQKPSVLGMRIVPAGLYHVYAGRYTCSFPLPVQIRIHGFKTLDPGPIKKNSQPL